MQKKAITIQKPTLPGAAAALSFAEAANTAQEAHKTVQQENPHPTPEKRASGPKKGVSGLVPEGDVRLTANISEDRHLKLKIEAAKRRTTIGELIEQLIDENLA